jgi:TetR/AcrR family transcriptional repressor of nem operon
MPRPTTNTTPGRPREFEIDDAVESAMQVFWSRGYHGTSLMDLIDGTGLSRGSLYKAFGDKHGLFIAALERYFSESSAPLFHTLQKPGPVKAAIRETLIRFAQLSSAADGLRGCMLVATATEMVPHDAGVAECVKAMFDRMRDAYAAAIARGQAGGEIPAHHDAQALAGLIVCLTQGMRAVGKTGAAEKQMTAVVNAAMALLD